MTCQLPWSNVHWSLLVVRSAGESVLPSFSTLMSLNSALVFHVPTPIPPARGSSAFSGSESSAGRITSGRLLANMHCRWYEGVPNALALSKLIALGFHFFHGGLHSSGA